MIQLVCLFLFVSLVLGETDTNQNRIKGGETAQPGEFPYQVSVQLAGTHIGGGALISRKHVLTSASCLIPIIKNPELISQTKVLAGTISLIKDGFYVEVSRISVHPEYQYSDIWQSFINDIGIIHLNSEIAETNWTKPIHLPSITEAPHYAKLLFTGWGNVADPLGPSVEILNKAVLQSTSRQVCQAFFVDRRIMNSQLCTSANYNVGTCTTDTGSPLTYENELVGISTGFHGCARGIPDIFTKVSYYLQYIHDEIDFSVKI